MADIFLLEISVVICKNWMTHGFDKKGQTGLVKQAAEPLVLLHASSPP